MHTQAQRFIVEPIPMRATNSQRKRTDGAADLPPRGSATANWLSPDRVLTEADAAAALGCSKDTLRREFRAGRAPPRVRLSERRIGYRWSEIERWLRDRTEQPGESGAK